MYDALRTQYTFSCPVRGEVRLRLSAFRMLERLPGASHPAVYKGRIEGDTMTLTVTESDTKETVGTFTLVYGQQPHLMKCR